MTRLDMRIVMNRLLEEGQAARVHLAGLIRRPVDEATDPVWALGRLHWSYDLFRGGVRFNLVAPGSTAPRIWDFYVWPRTWDVHAR